MFSLNNTFIYLRKFSDGGFMSYPSVEIFSLAIIKMDQNRKYITDMCYLKQYLSKYELWRHEIDLNFHYFSVQPI